MDLIRRYVENPAAFEEPAGDRQADQPPAKKPKKSQSREEAKEEKIPSHIQTWQSYGQGSSLADIARERNLNLRTVQNHLLRASQEGQAVDWDAFLSPDQEELIVKAARQVNSERLAPIKEALPPGIDYFKISIALLKNSLGPYRPE